MKKLTLLTLTFSTLTLSQAWALKPVPEPQEEPPAPRKIKMPQLPPLAVLEEATLKGAGLDPREIESWRKGARWSAALPRLQVGLESKSLSQNTAIIQDNVSVTSAGVTIGPEGTRIDQDFGNNRNFEFKAVWALDELLFNRNQLEVSREARDLYLVRSRLLDDLHQSYYGLKALLVQFELTPELKDDPLQQLKVEQYGDKLNSLTRGEYKKLQGKHS